MPDRQARVSLGDLMLYVALVAVILAPCFIQRQMLFYILPSSVAGCVTVAIFFFNRRLSPWLWLVVASYVVRPLSMMVFQDLLRVSPIIPWFVVDLLIGSTGFAAGLALTFRDIQRKLAALQARAVAPLAEVHPLDEGKFQPGLAAGPTATE